MKWYVVANSFCCSACKNYDYRPCFVIGGVRRFFLVGNVARALIVRKKYRDINCISTAIGSSNAYISHLSS